jgi:hypothetical protein
MTQRALPEATPRKLPRWRGFNLLNKFGLEWSNRPFEEKDFEWIAELGFNFVRLPLDYRIWTETDNPYRLKEAELREIDRAVQFGEKYGIHVMLNFHRAPGYTVASPPEPLNLWKDEEAQRLCIHHWTQFAKRYKGKPNRQLSFNLFNEPANVDAESHRKVVERVVEAIRKEDADRLIVCDGRDWGMTPNEDLIPLQVAQATRGYQPFRLTHYRAEWVPGADQMEPPREYPLREGETVWDKSAPVGALLRPMEGVGAARRRRHGRRVRRVQVHPTHGRAGVDARPAGAVEAGGLGLGAVELPRPVRRYRQRPRRCGVPVMARAQVRPPDAGVAAGDVI